LITYTYDDLYRLTEESIVDGTHGNRTSIYVYDKVGNRQTKTVNGVTTVYRYDGNDRLLDEKVNGNTIVTYTYDNNGSTKTKTESGVLTAYTWNDEKRLVSATVNGSPVEYQYNDAGIRVSSKVGGVETRYLLDEGMTANVWEEYSPNGTVQTSYSYGYDLITQTQGTQVNYYLADGLGSIRLLTDSQGQLVNAYGYEAFGETVSQSGTASNKYQFAGEQFDGALGDYYLRQRFYDPSNGRFGRMDNYEGRQNEPITLHKYLYANNNPVLLTDPSGQFSMMEVAAQSAVLSALVGATFNAGIATYVGIQNNDLSFGKVVEASAKGALSGAIFGFTVGLAGPALAAVGIFGRTAGVLTGAVGGLTSNLGIQTLDITTGAQEDFQVESLLMSVSLGAILGAVVFRPNTAPQQQISHWSNSSGRVLEQGERYWVMTSGSYRSYGLAGISRRYGYADRQVTVVPASKLSYPEGLEAFKGLIGQRIYKP
jgi:RHS repeat-associated protein